MSLSRFKTDFITDSVEEELIELLPEYNSVDTIFFDKISTPSEDEFVEFVSSIHKMIDKKVDGDNIKEDEDGNRYLQSHCDGGKTNWKYQMYEDNCNFVDFFLEDEEEFDDWCAEESIQRLIRWRCFFSSKSYGYIPFDLREKLIIFSDFFHQMYKDDEFTGFQDRMTSLMNEIYSSKETPTFNEMVLLVLSSFCMSVDDYLLHWNKQFPNKDSHSSFLDTCYNLETVFRDESQLVG